MSDDIFNRSQWIWRAASHLTISKIDYQLLPNIQYPMPLAEANPEKLHFVIVMTLYIWTNMLLLNLKHSFPVSSNFIAIIIFDFWSSEIQSIVLCTLRHLKQFVVLDSNFTITKKMIARTKTRSTLQKVTVLDSAFLFYVRQK